jgi:transporter family protein
MMWMFFALLAAFSWACEALFDKVLREKYLKNSLALTASFGILYALFTAVLFLFIGVPVLPLKYMLAALVGGALITPCMVLYLKALSLEEASRVVPLWNFSPLFTLILSVIFLKEILNAASYAGFALILAGGFLISARSIKGIFRLSRAFQLMAITGFLWAISAILLKFAYGSGAFLHTFLLVCSGFSIGMLSFFILPSVRKDFSSSFSSKPFLIFLFLACLTAILGDFLNGNAYLTGPVALITVFTAFEGLFVLAIATFLSIKFPMFIKEAIDRKTIAAKIAAIAVMALGLFLISS